jgi:hypothetical protein
LTLEIDHEIEGKKEENGGKQKRKRGRKYRVGHINNLELGSRNKTTNL